MGISYNYVTDPRNSGIDKRTRKSYTLIINGCSEVTSQFFKNTSVVAKCKRNTSVSKWRSSRPEVFCKKGVLRNFANFTRKHLCHSLFFNKVAGLATLLKKRLWHRCFPVKFVKFLRTSFFIEHLWWLLL